MTRWSGVRRVALLGSLALGLAACASEGPTGPNPDPDPTPDPLLPESRPAVFAVGDTVVDAIEVPTDVDEYSFAAVVGSELMLNVSLLSFFGQQIQVSVHDATWNELFVVRANGAYPTLDAIGAPLWQVPSTGTYRVRVRISPTAGVPGWTGSYRFEFYRVNRAPETAPAAGLLGATISGETIHRRGDIDEFLIPLAAGDWVAGNLVTQMAAGGGVVTASLRSPSGSELRTWSHNSHTNERDSTISAPLLVAEAGTHKLIVTGSALLPVQFAFRAFETAVPFQIGVIHSGTVIAGDSVEARIPFALGTYHRLSLRSTSTDPLDTLVAVVRDTASGAILGEVRSGGTQVALHDAATWLTPIPATRPVRVTVRGADSGDDGGFEIMFRAPGAGPEHVIDEFALGDTVTGERFDGDLDHDTWRFTAAAGDEIMAYATLDSAWGTGAISMEVRRSGVDVTGWTIPVEVRPLERGAKLFTAPSTGEYEFVIVGAGAWEGFYRFHMARRDRAPESRPAEFAVGDTVSEALGEMGDIDEYEFVATAGSELMLNVAPAEPFAEEFFVRLYDANWNPIETVRTFASVATLDEFGASRWVVPSTGTYRVRVEAGWNDDRAKATGPYRFELYEVDRAPEDLAPAMTFGTPMDGESVVRRGDIDEFSVAIDSGTMFVGRFSATFTSAQGEVSIELVAPGGEVIMVLGRLGASGLTGTSESGRLEIVTEGMHLLRVTGASRDPVTVGFDSRLIDPAPEVVPPLVPPNVWVEGEAISPVFDLDRFSFTTVAGRWYAIQLEAPGIIRSGLSLTSYFPGSGWALSDSLGQSHLIATEARTYTMRLEAAPWHAGSVGPYRFRVSETDRRPETTDSVLALGDTITGEGLEEFGDVDEFYFSASNADVLQLVLSVAAGTPERWFGLDIEDAETSAGLNVGGVTNGTRVFDFNPGNPAVRTYRVRILAMSPTDLTATGGYTLHLRRKP